MAADRRASMPRRAQRPWRRGGGRRGRARRRGVRAAPPRPPRGCGAPRTPAVDRGEEYRTVARSSPARSVTARVVPGEAAVGGDLTAARRSASRRACACGRCRRSPAEGPVEGRSAMAEDRPHSGRSSRVVLRSAAPRHRWGRHRMARLSVRRPLPRQPHAAREGPAPRGGPRRAAGDGRARRTRSGRAGKCSGTMYCGDHEHYDVHERGVRAVRPRERAPARHVPEPDQVRGRDHRHDPRPAPRRGGHRHRARRPRHHRRHRQHPPRHARLPRARPPTPRRHARRTSSSPRPATPRSTRRATCSASRCATRPVDPETHAGRRRLRWPTLIDDNTIALIGSACNYGYGTIDPIDELSASSPWRRGIGLHVDGCLGGFILPFGQELGYDIPRVRLPRARRHQHLGRHPQVRLRASRARRCSRSATRRCATASTSSSPAGPAGSTARRASRAPARAGCSPRRGPRWCSSAARATARYAKAIFETADAMKAAVRSHPELRIMGDPTFCSASPSDEFDIYHVNDFMRPRGWRFNGQQYPNAHPHGRHPARRPSPAWPRRSPPTWPTRSPTPSEHKAEAPNSRRDLRRRGRRAHRRGRRVHPRGHGRHDGQPARPCDPEELTGPRPSSDPARASATSSFVLAIDLGTGGPKVGLVSLTGRIAWSDHCPVATRWLDGGGAVQDAERWWDLISTVIRAGHGRRRRAPLTRSRR